MSDDRSDMARAGSDSLDAKICFDIYATNLAFARFYSVWLEPHGLTYPNYLVLTLLWERDGQSLGEIGAALSLKSNTLTPLVKRMEAAGLLVRERSSVDERQVMLKLTTKGKALQTTLADLPACTVAATGQSHETLRALQLQLRQIRAHLGREPR
ncbi:MarR family transcriptional regulator [Paracoccus sp. TK19116]|uniref:MarR family transcriptional regulator n=1 Tax=Paracoccus albicereus TaxID=2922394 RepID=A0ABT1MTG3_9RHOB|nr:MarR family transcriptional regulator [Paracoccus albicereus]MCQ0971603.1 MarR family transcriptional regulator [Paracoccus albicereus]